MRQSQRPEELRDCSAIVTLSRRAGSSKDETATSSSRAAPDRNLVGRCPRRQRDGSKRVGHAVDRLLITGATGFIGRAVVRALLDAGHVVGAVVRRGSDTTPLDDRASRILADGSTEALAQAVQDFRPDAAIHAATYFRAQHVPADIAPMIEANLLFGCQLFDALMRAGCTRW